MQNVITVRPGQSFVLGGLIQVNVLATRGKAVRLVVQTPFKTDVETSDALGISIEQARKIIQGAGHYEENTGDA